ncbi:MAG: DUF1501 domain-containing protein [Candidatus Eremiobacteraeota bacterium]|nr:DUF1501 domain-containing protein [Candidatus Eremiobacteraeota bacterium]
MKRSRFLLGGLAGLTVTAAAGNLFGAALAQPVLPGLPGGTDDRVLVIINLQGGNDGLNTVVPHGMAPYYRYRPTLGIAPQDVLHIDGTVGLNPQLASLKGMYDAGNVAIVQGAGYPGPDHSHFRSTEIWQTAEPEHFETTGWIGRYLDAAQLPKANLFNAVALAPVLPELMISRAVDVPAIAALQGYGLSSDRNVTQRAAFTSLVRDDRVPFNSPYLASVATIEDHAQRGSEELPKLIAGYSTNASYPATALGRSLALAAQIVGSRLGTRVIYVQHGSFDTHAAQKPTQDRLLRELSDGLKAFYDDLAAHGNDKRTLTMTFSEFGRRVAENASRGTDHGEAAPMFLVGGGIKGGLYGRHPSLDALDNGDATFTVDFRSVYATVIQKWLGRPTAGVLAGNYPTLGMLA